MRQLVDNKRRTKPGTQNIEVEQLKNQQEGYWDWDSSNGEEQGSCGGGNWVHREEDSEGKPGTGPWDLCGSEARVEPPDREAAEAPLLQEARCSSHWGLFQWSQEPCWCCEAGWCCHQCHLWCSHQEPQHHSATQTCWGHQRSWER